MPKNKQLELSVVDTENNMLVINARYLDVGDLGEGLRRVKLAVENYLKTKSELQN